MHQTRLSQYAAALAEAGWLSLLIAVPTVAFITTVGSFQTPKIAVLRSVMLILVLAWVIQTAESGPVPRDTLSAIGASLRRPLVVPVLLLVGVYLLATVLSTAPRLSIWGAYGRWQGTYTLAAYVVIFFVLRSRPRSWPQLGRIIDAALLASCAAAVFAILQRLSLVSSVWQDAIAFFGEPRPPSTLGNPVFLGSFLVLVIPFTLYRLYTSLTNTGRRPALHRRTLVGTYGLLFLVQESALVLSASRGPFFAHVVSLVLVAVLWGAVTGRRRVVGGVLVLATALAFVVMLYNLPVLSPALPSGLGPGPRILQVANLHTRAVIWESVADLVTSNPARAIVGHGPETMASAVLPYLTEQAAELADARGQHWESAHNATWDAVGGAGIIGLLAHLVVWGAVFYYALRRLGLVAGASYLRAFIACLVIAALLGAVAPLLITGSWRWSGLALSAGFVAGLMVYLVGVTLVASSRMMADLESEGLLLVPLLAALLAHFIDVQVVFPTATSSLYFWTYAAVVAVLSSGVRLAPAPTERVSGDRARPARVRRREASMPAGIALDWLAVAVGTLGSVLVVALLIVPNVPLADGLPAFAVTATVTWLVGAGFVLRRPRRTADVWLSYLAVSLCWLLVCGGLYAAAFYLVGVPTNVTVFICLLIVSLLLLALTLRETVPFPQPKWRHQRWLYVPIALLVGVLVWFTDLELVRADVYFSLGQAYTQAGDPDAGVSFYRRALALRPDQDVYYLRLSEAYAELAAAAPTAEQRNFLFEQARLAAWQAWQLHEGQVYHALNLAHVYLLWAQAAEDPDLRATALDQAAGLYAQASSVLRYDPKLYREWGAALQLQGDDEGALDKYRTSLNLDAGQAETYRLIGYLYQDLGKLDAAEQALTQAVSEDPDRVDVYVALGEIYQSQGRLREALVQAQRAVERAPHDYRLHLNLGLIYHELGRESDAIQTVQEAQELAPEAEQARLSAILTELSNGAP